MMICDKCKVSRDDASLSICTINMRIQGNNVVNLVLDLCENCEKTIIKTLQNITINTHLSEVIERCKENDWCSEEGECWLMDGPTSIEEARGYYEEWKERQAEEGN